MRLNRIMQGNVLECLAQIPDEYVDCIITSPPYWRLRDYGVEGQIGLEPTLEEYLEKMLAVTAELKRVLKKTGVMFWNHDTNWVDKCMTLQEYRLAMRMIDEQDWFLRSVIIWNKANTTPSSFRDRFAHKYEPVFMFTKEPKYWFDLDAVRVPHRRPELQERKFGGGRVGYVQMAERRLIKDCGLLALAVNE